MKNLDVTLRPATFADERFLFDLRRSTMDEHLERAGESADDHTHWKRIRYRFEDASIICCGPEKIGLFKFFRDSSEWTIVQIQILPAHQGRGIASALIGEFVRQADNAHVSVVLSVLKGNRAINLYQRLGFKVMDQIGDSFLMRRG